MLAFAAGTKAGGPPRVARFCSAGSPSGAQTAVKPSDPPFRALPRRSRLLSAARAGGTCFAARLESE